MRAALGDRLSSWQYNYGMIEQLTESRLIIVGDLLDNIRESFFSIILEYSGD